MTRVVCRIVDCRGVRKASRINKAKSHQKGDQGSSKSVGARLLARQAGGIGMHGHGIPLATPPAAIRAAKTTAGLLARGSLRHLAFPAHASGR